MRNRRRLLYPLYILAVAASLGSAACSGNNSENPAEKTIEENEQEFPVSITVAIDQNLIFSKYDVSVSIDGNPAETVKHGSEKKLTLKLKEGAHTIQFSNDDDPEIKTDNSFSVNGDTYLYFELACKSDVINVTEKLACPADEIVLEKSSGDYAGKNYETVGKELHALGFKSVNPIKDESVEGSFYEDGEITEVTADGKPFDKETCISRCSKIEIKYYAAEKRPSENQESSDSEKQTESSENSASEEKQAEEKPSEEKLSFNPDDLSGDYVYQIEQTLLNEGWNITYTHAYSGDDFTQELPWEKKEYPDSWKQWRIVEVTDIDPKNKNIEISIINVNYIPDDFSTPPQWDIKDN